MSERWSVEAAQALLGEVFAPWIDALDIKVREIDQSEVHFVLPENPNLSRRGGEGGGVVCGQAIGAAADTCSVVTLSALNGTFRPCTTVDLTVHFMRPLPEGPADISVSALSNGRRMAATRTEFRGSNGKLAASVTCAFAYLDV